MNDRPASPVTNIAAHAIAAAGRIIRYALLAMALLAAAPAGASAAPVVEDFESPALEPGTRVGTQFRASSGLYFTVGGIGLPAIAAGAAARSPTRMLDITTRPPAEFPIPGLEGRFDNVVTSLTVPVRNTFTSSARLRLDAYGVTSGMKTTGVVTVAPGAWVNLTAPAPDPGNSYSRFQVRGDVTDGGKVVMVDDISFEPDPAAVENFELLTEDVSGIVLPGQPKQYTIAIQRLNGFAGNVTLSADATGSGETIDFSPRTVSGSTSTVTLTLPPDAPESTTSRLTITATGAPGTRTLEIPYVVESPFQLTMRAPAVVDAHRCATTTALALSLNRHRNFTGSVTLAIRHRNPAVSIPDDHRMTVTPAAIEGGPTVTPVTVDVTRGDDPDDPAPIPLRVVARSGGLERSVDFDVRRVAPRLTSVTPTSLVAPVAFANGTVLAARGNGICPGAMVRVGNDLAQAPAILTPAPVAGNPTQVQAHTSTPRLATTGAVSVVNPSGAVATAPGLVAAVSVDAYRPRFGFSFANENGRADVAGEPAPVGAGSLRDWQELLGPRQTNLNACEVGALFPLCWEVITPVPSPQHLLMQTILGEATYYQRGGTCVGMAIASRRIAARQVAVDGRAPGPVTAPVWSLERTGRETIPGRGDIPLEGRQQLSPIKYAAVQHAAQTTAEFFDLWLRRSAANAINGPAAMRTAIQGHLRSGRFPLISVGWDGGGHAVNVYDIEDRPGGGFFLRVYDNNFPFLSSENAPDGIEHRTRDETLSRIEVTPGGRWIAHGLSTASGPRSGDAGRIAWIDVETEIPVVPSSLAHIEGWRVLATPRAGTAATRATARVQARAAQVADDGVRQVGYLDGDGSMTAARSDRARAIPVAAGPRGRTVLGVFGEGATAQVDASGGSAAGGGDRVLLPKGAGEGIGFTATSRAARVGLTLIADRAGRMVRVRGARRGTTQLRLVGKSDQVQLTHKGTAGDVTLELSSFADRGRAGHLETKLRLGAGSTVRLSPKWSRLGSTITAVVDGKRRVLRNRAKPPVRVASARVAATRSGARTRATVRAGLRGTTAALRALTVRVEIRQGKAVVGRATRQLRTNAAAIRSLRRGVAIDVPVDAAKLRRGGRLTARAHVTASSGSPLPIGSSMNRSARVR